MSFIKSQIRPGVYFDSIVLMQLQVALANQDGVEDAGAVMGTETNKALLKEAGLLSPEAQQAGPDDLVFVVRAGAEQQAALALAEIDSILSRRRKTTAGQFRPKSLRSASGALPEADWVLISVPGRYAAKVAQEGLEMGKHIFLYSYNVSLQEEIQLKQAGRERGLLVMGPDCGTAIINGFGLGFANRVRRGRVGLIGASGTGLQAVSVGIHNRGGGISQAIGTGGRDLKAEVGGSTTLQALDMLGRDGDSDVLVLISKPPEPELATRVINAAAALARPVVVNFLGHAAPARQMGNIHFAATLQHAAELAVQLSDQAESAAGSGRAADPSATSELGSANPDATGAPPPRAWLRGLFSGGTLAYEAVNALQNFLHPLYTNVPLRESQRIANAARSQAHTILDLGEDEFTVGRLHPMMDNDLRIRRLRQEASDPDVGVLLLDVVLGEGAHPDPAAELGPVIAEITATGVETVVILVGTADDPQDYDSQAERLSQAGASLFQSVTEAVGYLVSRGPEVAGESGNLQAREASRKWSPGGPGLRIEPPVAPLPASFAAINVGLESFYDSLISQGAAAIQVDWRPPAGGNERMLDILARLKSKS